MDDFFFRALIAGIAAAAVAGPLGCFVVWRRMAYFGDALSHSALLGIALGLLLSMNLSFTIIAVCFVMALTLMVLQKQQWLSSDTLLGILAHTALSLGVVVSAMIEGLRLDLMSFLFGDILTVSTEDVLWITGGGLLVLTLLAFIWKPLLSITVHQELAKVEGVNATWISIVYMFLIATVIAIAMRLVGVLLITALLIIPPAAARQLARTPEQMAMLAALLGSVAVAGGLAASLHWDTPAGPSVVIAAGLIFSILYLVPLAQSVK